MGFYSKSTQKSVFFIFNLAICIVLMKIMNSYADPHFIRSSFSVSARNLVSYIADNVSVMFSLWKQSFAQWLNRSNQ